MEEFGISDEAAHRSGPVRGCCIMNTDRVALQYGQTKHGQVQCRFQHWSNPNTFKDEEGTEGENGIVQTIKIDVTTNCNGDFGQVVLYQKLGDKEIPSSTSAYYREDGVYPILLPGLHSDNGVDGPPAKILFYDPNKINEVGLHLLLHQDVNAFIDNIRAKHFQWDRVSPVTDDMRAVHIVDGEATNLEATEKMLRADIDAYIARRVRYIKSSASCSSIHQLLDVCPAFRALKAMYATWEKKINDQRTASRARERRESKAPQEASTANLQALPRDEDTGYEVSNIVKALHAGLCDHGIKLGKRADLSRVLFRLSFMMNACFSPKNIRSGALTLGFPVGSSPYVPMTVLQKAGQWEFLTPEETKVIDDTWPAVVRCMATHGQITEEQWTDFGWPWGRFEQQFPRNEAHQMRHRAETLSCPAIMEQQLKYRQKQADKLTQKQEQKAEALAALEVLRAQGAEHMEAVRAADYKLENVSADIRSRRGPVKALLLHLGYAGSLAASQTLPLLRPILQDLLTAQRAALPNALELPLAVQPIADVDDVAAAGAIVSLFGGLSGVGGQKRKRVSN